MCLDVEDFSKTMRLTVIIRHRALAFGRRWVSLFLIRHRNAREVGVCVRFSFRQSGGSYVSAHDGIVINISGSTSFTYTLVLFLLVVYTYKYIYVKHTRLALALEISCERRRRRRRSGKDNVFMISNHVVYYYYYYDYFSAVRISI